MGKALHPTVGRHNGRWKRGSRRVREQRQFETRENPIDGSDQVFAPVRRTGRYQFRQGYELIGEMLVRPIVALIEERNRQHHVACNQRRDEEYDDLAADTVRKIGANVELHDASTFAANR